MDISSSASSPTSFSEVGTNQVSIDSFSIEARLNQEVEPVMPCIILEPEEKKKKKDGSEPKGQFQGETT